MRFVCDSCRAQYMISDDKVGANGVKVRCKKCGNVIVVRRPQDTEADAALRGLEESAPQPPAPEAPTGENSIFSDVDDEEIGAAFESALGERQDDEPVAPPQEEPPPEANLPPVSDGPPRAHDWYVAIDDKQTGPLTPDAIKDHWDRGEIGPDSLTWRQGFEDWVPLSEVSELAAWLAPRPQRPVFSPPPPSASGSMPVVPVPVESAFNAGGVMRTVRAEVPTPVPEAVGGWKPSASAALASLVKEEIDALSKPDAPPPAPEPVVTPRGLLEVPPPTGEVPAASVNGRPARTEAPTPVTAVERPPSFSPAYPYATRPMRTQGGNKGLLIGIGVAVLVVLGAVGGVGWYVRQKASEIAVRQASPPPPEPAKVTPPPEPPKVAQAQPSQAAQPAATTPPVTPSVAAPVAKVTPAVAPGEGSGSGTRRGTRGSRHGGKASSGGGDEQVASAETPARSSGGKQSKADDLFDEVFGTGGGSSKSEESRSSGKKTAYVPPAPGSSSTEVPERLPKGDIMSVVLANKPSIVRCVNEQKTRDPNLHGTLVMHWVIQTSGKTTSVNAVTDQFRSSYMATCLTGLVKSWNFPKHKYQPGEPVDFPFTF
jgi:predicted Zn finger-like uncharacterized protein